MVKEAWYKIRKKYREVYTHSKETKPKQTEPRAPKEKYNQRTRHVYLV